MLTEDMKVWHGLVIAVVSFILQACLFTAINYLLCRNMAKKSERILKGARLQAPGPGPAHRQPLAAQEKETRSTPVSEPHYRLEEIWLSGFPCTEVRPQRTTRDHSQEFNVPVETEGPWPHRDPGPRVSPEPGQNLRLWLPGTSEIIIQPSCFTGSKARHKKGYHLPRVSDTFSAKPVPRTEEARAVCLGPHRVSVSLIIPPNTINPRVFAIQFQMELDGAAVPALLGMFLPIWRGSQSLFSTYVYVAGSASLSPSSFHCVHSLLTPSSFPWKNSLYFSVDDSDTSSDSSNSSDNSDSSPQNCQATKDVNYTQVIFSTPGGLKNESALDYENLKETTDYVNVYPKSHKPNFWTFANPADSEPVEYTQVAM